MIVDDQAIIRAGLATVIDALDGVWVVAQAADGLEAVRLLEQVEADVVLLDLAMPGIDGVETIRRIRSQHPPGLPRILVLTTFDQDRNVLSALRSGADGFLGKGVGPAELGAAVWRVHRGGRVLSGDAVDAVVDHLTSPEATAPDPAATERFAHLTPRELEIVGLVVQGMSNQEIAKLLYVSPFTVKTHVNRAMAKAAARDRAHLVSLAVMAGFRP